MIGGLVAGAVMLLGAEDARGQVNYDIAIFAATNEYCSQLASGNQNAEMAYRGAIQKARGIYPELIRNNPALFEQNVQERIAQTCPPPGAAEAKAAQDRCPGLTHGQIQRIAAGQRVTVAGPGCLMQFH